MSAAYYRALGFAAVAGGCAVLGSIGIHLFAAVNSKDPSVIWYPLPTLLISIAVAFGIERRLRQQSTSTFSPQVWLLLALFTVLCASLGVYLMGWTNLTEGRVLLAGELKYVPGTFRQLYPFVIGVSAGFIEEAVVRGLLQLPVERHIGRFAAQALATAVFIGVHALEGMHPQRFTFLLALAVCSGLLAAKSRSTVPSIALHVSVNGILPTTVLFLRP